jgi:hypothetical protein
MKIIIKNLSGELKRLFLAYLENKDKVRVNTTPTNSYVGSRAPSYRQASLFEGDYDFQGIIYFYEWSDTNRAPKSYYTLRAFENFLTSCQIYLLAWQKEIIKHMHNPYIACKKGQKDLVIKDSFEKLKNALALDEAVKNPFHSTGDSLGYVPPSKGSEDREPYAVSITRPPVNNAPKVLSCKVFPPVVNDRRCPPMYTEEVGRWFG